MHICIHTNTHTREHTLYKYVMIDACYNFRCMHTTYVVAEIHSGCFFRRKWHESNERQKSRLNPAGYFGTVIQIKMIWEPTNAQASIFHFYFQFFFFIITLHGVAPSFTHTSREQYLNGNFHEFCSIHFTFYTFYFFRSNVLQLAYN